jgi:hypothetical protein
MGTALPSSHAVLGVEFSPCAFQALSHTQGLCFLACFQTQSPALALTRTEAARGQSLLCSPFSVCLCTNPSAYLRLGTQ